MFSLIAKLMMPAAFAAAVAGWSHPQQTPAVLDGVYQVVSGDTGMIDCTGSMSVQFDASQNKLTISSNNGQEAYSFPAINQGDVPWQFSGSAGSIDGHQSTSFDGQSTLENTVGIPRAMETVTTTVSLLGNQLTIKRSTHTAFSRGGADVKTCVLRK